MSQYTGFIQLFFLLVFACANTWLSAQTKIELGRTICYLAPSDEPENAPGEQRILTNNSWKRMYGGFGLNCFLGFEFSNEELERIFDGMARIHNYSNYVTTIGMYIFRYDSEGYSGQFDLWFPSVKNIKKIEFFDKDNNKMFEDLFEEMPLFNFCITKVSDNSFSVESWPNVFVSNDRAKTWKWTKVDYSSNTFSISEDMINSQDLVIVAFAHDPNPPHAPGVALWAPNPDDYVLEFADDDVPPPQATPAATTSNNNTNTKKGFFSKIFGK